MWNKKDNKTLENYIHQYKYAGNYVDRKEAIEFAAANQKDLKAWELLKTALKDKYHGLRNLTLNAIDFKNKHVKNEAEPILLDLIKNDKKSTVRGNAIGRLAEYEKPEYKDLFKSAIKDSSYTVAGNALLALSLLDETEAMTLAKELYKTTTKGVLKTSVTSIIAGSGDESLADEIIGGFKELPISQQKFEALNSLAAYLGALKNTEKIKGAVDEIIKFRDAIPEQFRNQTDDFINVFILQGLVTKKEEALKADATNTALKELIDYIKGKIPAGVKKGF